MKIIVPAIGSRGDVQPYVALCQALQAAGHRAILATNPTLVSLGESYGVETAPVGPPVDMGREGALLWEKSGNNLWLGLIRVMQLSSRLTEQAFPDILALCRDADLVVVSDPSAGAAEAQKLGIPWVSVTLQPSRVPAPTPNPSLAQKAFSRLVWPLVSSLMMAPVNGYRRRVGAPRVKDLTDMMSNRLILIPVSPHVVPPAPGWPKHVRVTGYWVAQPDASWQPPADLLDFLAAGEQPIAVSLGAMSLPGSKSTEAAAIAVQAIQQSGVRAIIQGWDEVLRGIPLPASIYHAGSLPHTWLFDQVHAVVHHGGFGTTAAGLRAGKPSVVVPHIIDQFYWAQQVEKLGVGPQPVPRAKLSVETLSAAITQACHDEQMRANAARLGELIRTEPDGLQAAVRALEAAVR